MVQSLYTCIGICIMETTNYNLRIDKALRDKSFAVIESFGLSPAQAIRLFLKQTAETDSIPLSFDYHRKPSDKLLHAITEMENGEYTEYTSVNALLDDAQN